MITNWANEVLYTGMMSDLERRLYEHINGTYKGFSKKYNAHKLVFCEEYNDANEAIRGLGAPKKGRACGNYKS